MAAVVDDQVEGAVGLGNAVKEGRSGLIADLDRGSGKGKGGARGIDIKKDKA